MVLSRRSMAVQPGLRSKTPVDVPSMTNAIHMNDTCRVVHSIKNPVISLPQAVTVLSNKTPGTGRVWIGHKVIDGTTDSCLHPGWEAQEVASRPALDFDPVGDLRLSFRASALTSSHEWNPVAPFMAPRRSSASRRSSIFSRSASSTTKLFWRPSRLQTASRVSARSTGSFVVSVLVSTGSSLSCVCMPDLVLPHRGGL